MSQVEWVQRKLKESQKAISKLQKSRLGSRILICSHLEPKLAAFSILLKNAGFEIDVISNLPSSFKPEVRQDLWKNKIRVFDNSQMSFQQSEFLIEEIVNSETYDFIFDDGAHSYLKIKNQNLQCIATEFTQSGVNQANANKLKIPVVNLNSSFSKMIVGNVFGTGLSAMTSIQSLTNISFKDLKVGIIGFGKVGLGCAITFKSLGSQVCLFDIDDSKAEYSKKYGFDFVTKRELLENSELIITCTGKEGVLAGEDFKQMNHEAILANVGHFDYEIIIPENATRINVTKSIEEINVGKKKFYLLVGGKLVNLAHGQGYPVEIIDLSFAAAVYSWDYFSQSSLSPGLYEYPAHLDLEYFSTIMKKFDLVQFEI